MSAEAEQAQEQQRLEAVEQEFLQELLQQQREAQVAVVTHVQFLFRKYGLRSGVDSINQDGTIVRAAAEPVAEE